MFNSTFSPSPAPHSTFDVRRSPLNPGIGTRRDAVRDCNDSGAHRASGATPQTVPGEVDYGTPLGAFGA